MKPRWQRLPLHLKMFISFALLILASLVAVFFYASVIVTRELDNQAHVNIDRAMQSTAQEVQSELTLLLRQTQLMANNQGLKQALADYQEQTDVEKWQRWRLLNAIRQTWSQARNAMEMRLHLAQNTLFLRDNIWLIPNLDVPNALIAVQGDKPQLWSVDETAQTISCFVPVQVDWARIGYIEIVSQSHALDALLDGMESMGLKQAIYFGQGDFVTGALLTRGEVPLQTQEPFYRRVLDNAQAYLRAVYPIGDTPFYLVGEMPSVLISQKGRAMLNSIAPMGLLVLVLAFLIAFWFSRSITMRLRTLSLAMKKLEAGDLNVQIAQSSPDELGQMLRRFDKMARALQSSYQENELAQRKKRESDLKLLQSQINPHFIHNTLESISWAAKAGDKEMVAYLVQNLSGFLRLSLVKTEQMATLSRELQLVRFYFNVQSYRFKDRLTLCMDVEPRAMEAQMLPLIIQPLVENALLHGILPSQSGAGTITLRARVMDNILIIEVSDDGIGMDAAQLQTLREQLDDPAQGSYGLWNVHQRVRGHAGEDYGLSIQSEPEQGTQCLLTLPSVFLVE